MNSLEEFMLQKVRKFGTPRVFLFAKHKFLNNDVINLEYCQSKSLKDKRKDSRNQFKFNPHQFRII